MNKRIVVGLYLISSALLNSALADALPNFTKLIKDNANTVVQIESRNINSTNKNTRQYQQGQPMPDDLLKYFFNDPLGGPNQPGSNAPSLSHGSGFFIDNHGYVITNAHVVKDGDEIIVSTTEQKEYKAKLIGLDERTDVALLKINKNNTPAVKIGNSDKIEVGNWVLAIGSPFGFDYTATKGIISAVSRSLPDGTYVPFIQTDAAVNPGNSGGPLFNLDGEVIGVNSQIYSRTGSFNGLAFAIPINTAMHIAEQIKSNGFVSRGWLGVGIQGIDQDLATSFGLDTSKGALIASVMPQSPAHKAGLKVGDVILKFNGKNIKKASDLPPLVGTVAVGKKVNVDIVRNGKQEERIVIIGELDEGQPKIAQRSSSPEVNNGLSVSALTAQKKREIGVANGVLVTAVAQASKAADAGFRVGDVIVNVDNRAIDSVAELYQQLKPSGSQPMAVLVIRQGRSLFIPL